MDKIWISEKALNFTSGSKKPKESHRLLSWRKMHGIKGSDLELAGKEKIAHSKNRQYRKQRPCLYSKNNRFLHSSKCDVKDRNRMIQDCFLQRVVFRKI